MNTRRRIISLLIPAVLAVLIACGVEEDAPASGPNDVPSGDTVGESTPDAVPGSTPIPATSTTELQEARIHSISVIVLESDPPQYTAQVRVIQPDGCATFDHVQARQHPDETDIFLDAFNEVVVGEAAICTENISTFEQPVPLGIDFEPGVTYTISGGGASATFAPQGQPPAYSFDRFLAELDGLVGAVAGERVEQPFSTVPAQLIDVTGGTVQVYEFETIAQAINMAVDLEQNQQIDWIDTPHFLRRGNVFAIYIGNDSGVLEALSSATRSEFPRPFDPDASFDTEPAEPAGPVGGAPTPTPAPPGEFTLGLKVIPDGPNFFLFVAELMGGPDNEESLYCQGWTLAPGDGTGFAAIPSCAMYTPDVEIQRHFEMSHAYQEPGVYEAMFEYGHLTSNSVRVVVESVEATATVPDVKEPAIIIPENLQRALDIIDPSIDSFSAKPGFIALGDSFTISFSVSDTGGSGLNRVELQRAPDNRGSPGLWAEIDEQAVSGDSDSGFFTDAPPTVGTYWYGLHAVDNNENRATEEVLIAVGRRSNR